MIRSDKFECRAEIRSIRKEIRYVRRAARKDPTIDPGPAIETLRADVTFKTLQHEMLDAELADLLNARDAVGGGVQ